MAANPPKGFAAYIAKLARKIWNTKQPINTDPVLVESYGKRLEEAVMKGYGEDLDTIDWNTPDYEMLRQLEKNVWHFSAAKTYTQLRDMSKELIGPDGKLRSWENFKLKVGNISGKQLAWLKVEWNDAIGGARMAALWVKIQSEKERFPLLQFWAVIDDGTTTGCKSLHLVIKPVDDDFWNKYYPLLHHSCRSTVKQLKEGTITPDEDIKYPDVPEIFQVNLGQRGLIFPEGHAYYTDMPQEVYDEARKHMPYRLQFDDLANDERGKIREHFMIDKTAKDYPRLIEIAKDKGKDEIIIDLMPTLDPDTFSNMRPIIFKGAKKGKSPDLKINGRYAEEEFASNPSNFNNIKHAISAGAKQADHVIITVKEMPDYTTLLRAAKGRFIDYPELELVEFRNGDRWISFKREDLIK